jgi:hypothetical protein
LTHTGPKKLHRGSICGGGQAVIKALKSATKRTRWKEGVDLFMAAPVLATKP